MPIAVQHPLIHKRPLCGATPPSRTTTHKPRHHQHTSRLAAMGSLQAGDELDDTFTGLADTNEIRVVDITSLMISGPQRPLEQFTPSQLTGYRRVFAHCADIFYARGVANPTTGEVSSLSCEPCSGGELIVAVFEVPGSDDFVKAFIQREHEFRFVAVEPDTLQGQSMGRLAVLCARNTDEEYKAKRCPPDEWQRRWAVHGVQQIWRDDILPCRVYLRHCVLAAKACGGEAYDSFMDQTFLADRKTTIREPPPELVGRYSG